MQKYKAEVIDQESKIASLAGRIQSIGQPKNLKEKGLSENSES